MINERRKLLGCFSYLSVGFLPSLVANLIAIQLEKSDRIQSYSLHVANAVCFNYIQFVDKWINIFWLQATETLYNILVSRGILRPVAHGKILLLSMTLAVLFRWFRTTQQTKSFQFRLLSTLIGEEERSGNNPTTTDHHLCPHLYENCCQYLVRTFVTRFVCGWAIHAFLSALPVLVRNPSTIPTLLSDGNHLRFGAFLASMAASYRVWMIN